MSSRHLAALALTAIAGTASAEITVTPELVRSFDVLTPDFSERGNPHAAYSNIDTFTGGVVSNGGAQSISGNVMTRMLGDDLALVGAQSALNKMSFSVSNLNGSAVSARARIRLYTVLGTGLPGTLLTGMTSTTMNFGPGSVSIFTVTFPDVAVPDHVWAGILFDNNGGATGAGVTELNNLGQGVFNPPAIGTSADLYFRTAAAGSFLVNNPAGALQSGGAGATANFGWELVPAPGAAGLMLGLGIFGARRRR